MRSLIQTNSAYELSVDITSTAYGHSLKLISFVPSARRPEDQIKFQGIFATAELTLLRDALTSALEESQHAIPLDSTIASAD